MRIHPLTYSEAYDKIIDAYFRDEIQPNDAEFCLCGTICGSDKWHVSTMRAHNPCLGYRGDDFIKMEIAFFEPILKINPLFLKDGRKPAGFENALFLGMSAALDVLKEIHKSRGEDVDQISKPFTKRQLV